MPRLGLRRVLTTVAVALVTAGAALLWLHDGDAQEAWGPVRATAGLLVGAR